MSIAEQIMVGTQQTNVLAQNLSALGQQVGRQLAINQYQKDAAAVLPAMRESYKSAFNKMGQGKYADGYMELLDTNLQFGATTNPFIAQFADRAIQTAADLERTLYREAQYGGRGGGGGGTGAGIPAVRQPQGPKAFFNNGNVPQEYDGGEMPVDESVGGEGVGDMMAQDNGTSFGGGITGNWSFTSSDYTPPSEELTESFKENEAEYLASSPEEAVKYRESVSASTVPKGTQFVELPGLSNFKGFENVKGVFIPNKEYIDFPKSLSVTEDEKGKRFKTDFEKVQVNQQQIEKANALAYTDAPTAIGRVAANQSLERFFRENSPEQLDIGERTEDGQPVFYIGVRNTKDYTTISKDDYIAARGLRDLPATSRTLRASLAISESPAAAPAAGGSVAERVRSQYGKKEGAAQPAATPSAPAAQAPEATLEERIASKTKSAAIPTRTVTPQQQATLERTRQSQTQSNLQSEKTRLERVIYETPRGGQRKLKSGLTQKDPDVKEVLAKITEINKKLEGL